MTNQERVERPDFLDDEHLTYLDELRASGETNMYGARPYLMREFSDLTKDQALAVLMYWQSTFPTVDISLGTTSTRDTRRRARITSLRRFHFCGHPYEPLLAYEMEQGERGYTDLCRACYQLLCE